MKSIYKIKEVFGNNIRKARKQKGWSQEHLAELVGIGVPAISKIERGKSFPNEENLNSIITVLKIQPHLLFKDENDIDAEEVYKNILKRIDNIK